MKKNLSPISIVVLGFAMLFLASGVAFAQTQTAQSAMVNLGFSNGATYQIDGTITWTYDRDNCAVTYYTNAWDGNPPVVTVGTGSPQTSPGIPLPDANVLKQHAQAERCVFFFGGNLSGTTYTQTVNGTRGWKWTYTYNITPNTPAVTAHTCWTSEETGGTVDVSFSGFVASESFQKQSNRSKYSFTMLDGGITRARSVTAQLQVSDGNGGWTNIGSSVSLDNVDTDGDTFSDGLDVTPATADFSYFGNGGVFGNSAVFGALHYNSVSGKAANLVSNILNGISDGASYVDNFSGNNNDLAAGNVHLAPFSSAFTGLTAAGTYRVVISGVIKGNSGSADFGFSVTSNLIVIGGCPAP